MAAILTATGTVSARADSASDLRQAAIAEVEAAGSSAGLMRACGVDPTPITAAVNDLLKRVPLSPAAEAAAPELRYLDAISDGLREAMRRDERVVLMGQDIAEYGGVFKATEGFVEEFGKARVRNTPIVESGAIGAALGLALGGFVPMVEMQFGDFITCAFNQIVQNLAKTRFRW
jgi:2-oxoisovalerate dehydrogenase E1 component